MEWWILWASLIHFPTLMHQWYDIPLHLLNALILILCYFLMSAWHFILQAVYEYQYQELEGKKKCVWIDLLSSSLSYYWDINLKKHEGWPWYACISCAKITLLNDHPTRELNYVTTYAQNLSVFELNVVENYFNIDSKEAQEQTTCLSTSYEIWLKRY